MKKSNSSVHSFERPLLSSEDPLVALDEVDAMCVRQRGYVMGRVNHEGNGFIVSTHTVGDALVNNKVTTTEPRCIYTHVVGTAPVGFLAKLDETYRP